jgi:peptidoglycan biosynthesis protein MviN/MurJ (putative lipid II flippase)
MEWLHTRLDQRVAILIAVVIFLLYIILGSYHITHGGPGSGRIELTFAPVFAILIVLALMGRSRQGHSFSWKVTRRSIITVIFITAVFFVGLSIYHFTHEGARSGGMEISVAFLLTILGLSL